MKLIKLSESHYIIVDDSEIKIGDYAIHNNKEYREKYNELPILCTESNCLSIQEHWNKVTHSTFLINESTQPDTEFYWNTIKEISLSEIEELIYGYSVEKMALQQVPVLPCWGGDIERFQYDCQEPKRKAWIEGFKAAMEINKDKSFTIEDMRKAFEKGAYSVAVNTNVTLQVSKEWKRVYSEQEVEKDCNLFIQSLLPPTQWEVEIDEQGKIKLI